MFAPPELAESEGWNLLQEVVGEDQVLEGASQGGQAVGHQRVQS